MWYLTLGVLILFFVATLNFFLECDLSEAEVRCADQWRAEQVCRSVAMLFASYITVFEIISKLSASDLVEVSINA